MSDDVNDDRMGGSDELAALSAVRDALEAVERQQERAVAGRQRLQDQWDSLLRGLRADALVMSFDGDGKLERLTGPVEDLLGVEPGEAVDRFDELLAGEERAEFDEANRRVLSRRAGTACSVADVESRGGSRRLSLIHIAVMDADGQVVGVEVIGRDVGDDGAASELPEQQERFEELMHKTSRHLLDSPDMATIRESLAALGEFLAVDRVVANGYDEDARKFSAIASWRRDGVDALRAETSGILISEFPWAYSVLGAGEPVVISEDADLPPEAQAEKALYATGDVRSALLMPMVRNDSLAGFVSVQSAGSERTWDDAEIGSARRFVSVLSGALARVTLMEDLRASSRDAQEAAEKADIATREIEETKAAEAQARQQLEDLSAATAASSARVEELETELEDLQRELKDAREAAGTADTVVEEAKASADEAREQLAGVRSELEDAQRDLEAGKADAERAQRRAEDTAADALAVRQDLEEARAQIEEARLDAAEARRQIQEREATEVEPPGDMETALEAEASFETDDPIVESESAPEADAADEGEATDEEESIEVPGLANSIAGAAGFDPDATLEFRDEVFDPDATLEIDPGKLRSAEDEPSEGLAPDGDPRGDEVDLDATVELPRALGLNEILERTQAVISDEDAEEEDDAAEDAEEEDDDDPSTRETVEVSLPSFLDEREALPDYEAGATASEDREEERIETGESAGRAIARDVEAARQLARQVAGKDTDEPADELSDEPDEAALEPDGAEKADDAIAAGAEWSFGGAASGTVDTEPEAPSDDVAEEIFDSEIEATPDDVPDDPVDSAPEADEELEEAAEGELDAEEELEKAAEGELNAEEDLDEVADSEPEAEERIAESVSVGVDPDPAEAPAQATALAGVDTAAGVAEVGGNAELYRNLVVKFRQDYLGAADKIGAAIEKGNVEIAHLLLNAVKGIAGVLGATRVHATADELETALIGGNLAVTRGAHGQFSAALGEVLDSIAGLDADTELIIVAAERPEQHVSDPKVLRSYLEGLRQHLDARKPRQCQLVIREVTARTWPGEINDDVDRLARAIRDEQFDAAQATFDGLISKLDG